MSWGVYWMFYHCPKCGQKFKSGLDTITGPSRPPPYILASAAFSSGSERADILNLGADICINKPVDSDEVIVLIRAVLRREDRMVRLNAGRCLPCIEYKGLVKGKVPLNNVQGGTVYAGFFFGKFSH